MRVIVTGGSGLIGRALVDSLAQDGHEVIVLSRNPDSVKNLPRGACAEKWDGKTAQTLFGEMAALLLDGQRQMPMRLVKEGFNFKFTHAEAALRDVLK